MEKPKLPGVSAWVIFSGTIVLFFLLIQFVPIFESFINTIAILMPAPFAGSVLFTLLLLSGIIAVVAKVVSASKKRRAPIGEV